VIVKKFTSKYKGPYRIIKVYANKTVDIADSSYVPQRVHVNRLKPLFETMLWRQEPCPAFESTFDVGNWYRATMETNTQTEEILNENAERAESDSSATCATSGGCDNDSDWETCSDYSEDSDNDENKTVRGKEDGRRDATEIQPEKTIGDEKNKPAETGVEPSTSVLPNKVKKNVGRPRKIAHPVCHPVPPLQTGPVAHAPKPPRLTHHPSSSKTNVVTPNNNENSTSDNKIQPREKRLRRRPARYADGADEKHLDQLGIHTEAKRRKN
jgi:hypothetical protein